MKSIKLGEREIMVRPSALTPMLFKRKTGIDLLVLLSDKKVADSEKLESITILFYIMAMQATCQDVSIEFEKATDEIAYCEFLDSLESKVLYSEEVISQIINVYMASTKSTSISKN